MKEQTEVAKVKYEETGKMQVKQEKILIKTISSIIDNTPIPKYN